jgi:hypothetical protein
MPRLVTEWSTDDPQIARTLQLIASLPEHSLERPELEAALHTFQAAQCHEQVGILRRAKDDRRRRTGKQQGPPPGTL